ncbi:hypothetical protein OH76DRAFT_973388 [Lentinus brumalis]|uniref:Uncharacterized protein n=1 Tax=Lentinus brumalis TaxID=2498619 RepID=A0A371DPR1_9APHY|nr:hypothetical protein OH76DRAFT_973388 [Polyporus brumalis]
MRNPHLISTPHSTLIGVHARPQLHPCLDRRSPLLCTSVAICLFSAWSSGLSILLYINCHKCIVHLDLTTVWYVRRAALAESAFNDHVHLKALGFPPSAARVLDSSA